MTTTPARSYSPNHPPTHFVPPLVQRTLNTLHPETQCWGREEWLCWRRLGTITLTSSIRLVSYCLPTQHCSFLCHTVTLAEQSIKKKKKLPVILTTACQLSSGPAISTCGPHKQDILILILGLILTSCRCGVIIWSPVKQCPDFNPIFSSNCSHRKMIVLKSPSAFEQSFLRLLYTRPMGHDR
jgi:hypothetical protein